MASYRPLEPNLKRALHDARTHASRDRVIVNRFALSARLRGANWVTSNDAALQPLNMTITAHLDTSPAALTEDLAMTLNYMDLAAKAKELVDAKQWNSIGEVADAVANDAVELTRDASVPPSAVTVELEQTEASLHANSMSVEVRRPRNAEAHDRYHLNGIRLSLIIGELEVERSPTQPIIVDVAVGVRCDLIDLHELDHTVQDPGLIERLCETTADTILTTFDNADTVDVRIAKPKAHHFVQSMDVAVRRTRADSPLFPLLASTSTSQIAVIALGSNMGDRADYLWRALAELKADGYTAVLDTSWLYESEPMYVVDQQPFLNAVCKIETRLSPSDLLSLCKTIEDKLGRKKTVDKGPRVVDLDIVLYGSEAHQSSTQYGELTIPHAALSEREFVLRPLVDIIPRYRHPALQLTIDRMLSDLMRKQRDRTQLRRVFALRSPLSPLPTIELRGRTHLMSILNTTPDSFSDGGDHVSLDAALAAVRSHIDEGADMIDIGGASTRPGAVDPSREEELRRVVPLVKAIRAAALAIPLSIDTYDAEVARQAVEAGGNLINDVTAGARSSNEIFAVAAALRCPVCLMHTRGTSETMSSLSSYDERQGGVVAIAAAELSERVEAAMRAGIPRWAILVDPGIGFAKDVDGNLKLLHSLADFTAPRSPLAGYPALVGASRKRFLGTLTGRKEAKERVAATGATVTASIAGGASIVRVHDVKEMKDVIAVSDAIYRPHLRLAK